MRSTLVRIAALAAGVVVVMSCDGGPTTTRFGNGISGGPSGTAPIVPPAAGAVDSFAPLVRIDTPVATPIQLVNVGDSILVVTRLNDDRGIASVTITGYKEIGDPNLGTFQRVVRYTPVTVPVSGNFRPDLVDTIVRRYLQPAVPVDTAIGPLVIEAILLDNSGNADTLTRIVQLVTGPKVFILSPVSGDSVPRTVPMAVSVQSTHPDGVQSITVRVTGEASWPTRLDTTITFTIPAATNKDVTVNANINLPANAPLRGRVTINASAIDVNRNPGSAPPIVIFIRAVATLAPRVYQTVPAKVEFTDSVTVTASGDGIRSVGRILRDSAGTVISRDSIVFPGPTFTSNVTQKVALNLGLADQGRRLSVTSFAWDNATPTPSIGYSLPQGISTPTSVEANAFIDTTVVTFGRTFPMPRNGVVGDLTVDVQRGNVFLSNTSFNLLEVWDNASKTFTAGGVAVGAQPWGLFVSNNPDTLLVGNSGATTISRVCIGNCAGGGIVEDLRTTPGAGRIRTRNTVNFSIQFIRDENTGKIRLVVLDEVSYSDRPQYVAQSQGGRVFYSTRPTSAQSAGTIRWLDPSLPVPDPRQIWQYGTIARGESVIYGLFNVDSVRIGAVPPGLPISDTLYIFDHPYGQAAGTIVVSDSVPVNAVAKARALGSDAEIVLGIDLQSLNLTDTTFVAASGDRSWIGFGEGNTQGGFGRIMMINDPPGVVPGFFSPAQTVTDIVDNSAERIFGLAIDSTGLQTVAHGFKTYMAAVDNPFHLRLDGEYDSFDDGAGVTYHPRAKSTGSANADRVAFSATRSGVIEIIDIAHYNNRGRLITKGTLYGPLRATGPLPGDPPEVILKLYGLTSTGLVVIDLRAADIKPGP